MAHGTVALQTDQDVNEPGVIVEISFRVLPAGEFLEQDLRKAGGSGLEADFGKLRGVIAAEEIQHVILVEAILQDVLLGEGPFEVTAHGPA